MNAAALFFLFLYARYLSHNIPFLTTPSFHEPFHDYEEVSNDLVLL